MSCYRYGYIMKTRAQTSLTPREQEVLRLRRPGLGYKGIADKLGISNNTVKGHFGRIFVKLGVNSSIEAFNVVGW